MPKSFPGSDKNPNPAAAAMDRRGFLTTGAAVGAAALTAAPAAKAADAINWDREVNVLVIGAGAGGLVAAIAAREKGVSSASRFHHSPKTRSGPSERR